jgi:hypothetical protein
MFEEVQKKSAVAGVPDIEFAVQDQSDDGLSGGAIAGIVIGVIVAIGLIAAVVMKKK